MESKFLREVGVDRDSGLTIGSVPIYKRTGVVNNTEKLSMRSSLSNEAIHIAVLTKSLMNES